MPAARGVKRTASKSSAATASTGPKNKKKRGAIQLEIPVPPKHKGCVMTCGQGDVGQLGLGEDVIETTKFKVVSVLGNKIVDVIAGGMHTIALDSDGKVWTFGCNDEGALGRPTANETDEGTPKVVSLPLPAVAISAGDSHSAVLLDNGDVYSWGAFRDSHGSMGLVVRGREGKPCKEPVRVDIGELAVGVASGGDHLVILSCTGSVYTMGCGEQGQLGRLAQRSASRDARQGFSALLVPSKVILKGGASRVWAGYHATFVLDGSSDKMFAWGLNNYGQLGITGEKRKTAIYSPTECDAMKGRTWQSVSAGQHHSLAIDERGDAHSVGRCEYGRLGLGDRAGDAETWEVIPKLQNKKCVSIAAGTSSSFAVTEAGEAYSWGMGSEGQLGGGGTADLTEPTLAPATGRALRVAAGGQHTAILVAREDAPAQMEVTPTPENEKEEEKAEPVEEKKRPNKRQKKQEQDEEISSTSSAQPADVKDEPEKVNGNEKKDPETETPMDVDDTDKPQDKEDITENIENTENTESKENTENKENTDDTKEQTDEKQENEQTDTEIESKDMDTSSQDTVSDRADEPDVKPEERPDKPDEVTEKPDAPDTLEVNGQPASA